MCLKSGQLMKPKTVKDIYIHTKPVPENFIFLLNHPTKLRFLVQSLIQKYPGPNRGLSDLQGSCRPVGWLTLHFSGLSKLHTRILS